MEKALKLVDVLGLDPRKCDSFSKFRQIFSFLCIVSVSLSSHVEFFLNFEGLETYERASESIVPQYQTIFKMLWFVVYKNEIIRMINKFRFFWKLEQFGDSELNTQYFFQIFFYIYVPMLAITCTLFTVVNFVFKTGKPISLCYGESKGLDSPEFEINVSVQAVVMVIIFLGVAGYDMIFFYFIANICMQFKMVKIVFGRRKIKTVTEAVKHHVFLLNYVDQLNEIYSSLLLFQYFSSLFGICFGLFLISKNGLVFQNFRKFKHNFVLVCQRTVYLFQNIYHTLLPSPSNH